MIYDTWLFHGHTGLPHLSDIDEVHPSPQHCSAHQDREVPSKEGLQNRTSFLLFLVTVH